MKSQTNEKRINSVMYVRMEGAHGYLAFISTPHLRLIYPLRFKVVHVQDDTRSIKKGLKWALGSISVTLAPNSKRSD
jgi:hypothetical protein